MVDIDDTIIEVHGYAKQGSGYGYSGVRGLNALLATVTTSQSAPVVVAQRLRKGSCGSPRGAARLVADALKTVASLSSAKALVRADSAFYGHVAVRAAIRGGADVSVTVRVRHSACRTHSLPMSGRCWLPRESDVAGHWSSPRDWGRDGCGEGTGMAVGSVAVRGLRPLLRTWPGGLPAGPRRPTS